MRYARPSCQRGNFIAFTMLGMIVFSTLAMMYAKVMIKIGKENIRRV